jgi:MOSC domain-containing protein YiiM
MQKGRAVELNARIRALNVGRAGVIRRGDEEIKTAFLKQPVDGALPLRELGFDGDEHVYEFHGGPDKAVLAYSHDHYAFWRDRHGLDLPESAAFGENLTVEGITEETVHLGDVFDVGTAVVQVTQPRAPCFKIAARYGVGKMSLYVQQTGYTGILFRVLQEGEVRAGQELRLRSRLSHGISVATANRVVNVDRRDLQGAHELLATPDLPRLLQDDLSRRLEAGGLGEDRERLYGE